MSRTIHCLIASAVILGLGLRCQSLRAGDPPGVAIVELFTSEGCNSCPPADRLLAKLVTDQARSKAPVYCLTFHVDYWDDLGWPDRFADPRFTQRQRDYAQTLKLRSLYTPQMIVNGQTEFVGSHAKTAAESIAAARQIPPQVNIVLTTKRLAADTVQIHYDLSRHSEGAVMHMALVENGLQSKVQRGENAGETLRHSNVVRAWETADLRARTSGDTTLEIPVDVNLTQSRIIGFVQQPTTLRILGASQTEPLESLPSQD